MNKMLINNKLKYFFALISLFIVILPLVNAIVGVSNPLPSNINLYKGESGRFKFQIQNNLDPEAKTCEVTLEGDSPLVVEFDDLEFLVGAKSIKEFYGTVNVPSDESRADENKDPLEYKKYSQSFCVKCSGSSQTEGAQIQNIACGFPINVNVVTERIKSNAYVPPKPEEPTNLIATLIILAGILVIIYLIYNIIEKRKKK